MVWLMMHVATTVALEAGTASQKLERVSLLVSNHMNPKKAVDGCLSDLRMVKDNAQESVSGPVNHFERECQGRRWGDSSYLGQL